MPSRMLLSLLLFAVFQAAAAQPGLEVPEDKPPRSRTTIAIGQYQSEFFFAKGDSNFVYGYAGPAPALVVTGEKSSVTGLGAGGGVWVDGPSGLPLIGSRGRFRATWLTTLGGVRDAEEELSDPRFTRTTDVDLEVQVNRVFGTTLGLAIGYTYRAQQRYGRSVSAVRDAFGGLHAGSIDQRFRQHALRLGVVL